MSEDTLTLPLIDLGPYITPTSPGDREKVITQVRDASREYGFFQVKGHGVPLERQQRLIQSIGHFFGRPKEEKLTLSFLQNPRRRGYEASGDSHREGDALPDSKEAFYIGREEPVEDGLHGPNVWPSLPQEEFRGPVWEYFESTMTLSRIIWEILLQGLGHPTALMEEFNQKPCVMMKMIRYPSKRKVRDGQFGVGPHNDFGGVTCLLQQPGKDGLEVWNDSKDEWLSVPAIEDILIINIGDMIHHWSGGEYKSARHRVINKADSERLSCATFWHGDLDATNPLNPNDPNRLTIGQRLFTRFGKQFTLSKKVVEVA